ncbi:hypothetical protein BKA66DRAFT_443854 [Pyrenochaeta sp. MPI-SDFR-AT-0127]|nr:hypothetical protein BKA66DRAFT_443854 [Pyrenochaeta sp. MPI-SDFR-AT-0127]
MSGCILHFFSYNRQKKRTLRHPAPITIRAQSPGDTKTTRRAILACDTASNSNVISQQLVTTVLREQYHPIDEQSTLPVPTQTYGEEIDGYVYLDWCWESNQQQWHNTRFFVTKTNDPSYDAVLGKEDAEYYGMLKARYKR